MLRFSTAGESHGKALISIVEGAPAGIPVLASDVNTQLARRQQGYGRGRRMKIETDQAEFISGIRAGETIGSPISMMIHNKDWKNWEEIMSSAPIDTDPAARKRAVTRPRPGHADLVGMLKYEREDARDILERASARETAARVAAGAIARQLLSCFGVKIGSFLTELGGIVAMRPSVLPDDINDVVDESQLRTFDPEAEKEMIRLIDSAKRDGDTLGGVCEVVVTGLPVGLGSHVSWDRKLDGRLAAAMMSIQAVKGVEIGMGFEAARLPGSKVHDEIHPVTDQSGTAEELSLKGFARRDTNNAGGLEGGITTGAPVVLKVAMKPISTLMRPLGTIDMNSGLAAASTVERSDVTAVPAMGVVAEAMAAIVFADAFIEKFGGDSVSQMRHSYEAFLASVSSRKHSVFVTDHARAEAKLG